MLTPVQQKHLASANKPPLLVSQSPITLQGGSVSTVVRLGPWVIKTINGTHSADIVTAEVEGLNALAQIGCLTPEIRAVHQDGLLLKYYSPVVPNPEHYTAFADSLASLHRNFLPSLRVRTTEISGHSTPGKLRITRRLDPDLY